MYRRITIAAIAAITTLTLIACGGNDETPDSATNATDTSTAAESSDNGPVVDRITDALDKLNVEWDSLTGPRYNAAANSDVRDLNIGGYDAGIHEFRTEESAKDWSDTSDMLGGIHVAFDTNAVSLNTKEGREESEELAPRLAEELDGDAHVANDPFAFLEDWGDETEGESAPQPTQASAQGDTEPATEHGIFAPQGQGYQCPGTDAFVWYATDCAPENLGGDPLPTNSGNNTAPTDDCPAYLCGYGTDENGNPNPSSGELQQQWMDEQGL